MCANLRIDDIITSTHCGHGHIIAKAGNQYSLAPMVAELYGRKIGVNKGKAGSHHLSDLEIGVLVAEGIQGTALTLAGGAALAAKLKGTDQVVVAFIGDGTLNTGRFHEGMNMASAWKLPLICYCENNIWAESTNIYDVTNLTKLTDRAAAFNVPGVSVDGNDVLAVHKVAAEAVARARKDECMKRDPIPRFRKKLIEMKVLTDKEADNIHQEVVAEMDEAVEFALESPFPDPKEVLTDVYA